MYSWKEDPPRRCISRSLGSIGSSDAYPFSPSRSGQLFKGDAEIRGRNAANRGNEGIVGKTRSLLTGTEPRAEERQREEREIGQNSERDGRRKGERGEEKKGAHTATRWAGRDACVRSHGVPCFHTYIAILYGFPFPSLSHLLILLPASSSLNFVSIPFLALVFFIPPPSSPSLNLSPSFFQKWNLCIFLDLSRIPWRGEREADKRIIDEKPQ